MQVDSFNWYSGEVVFWELFRISEGEALTAQVDDLTEDLALVRYPGEISLDVGWYPECSADGSFRVQVVRGASWNEPLFQAEHKTLEGLDAGIRAAIDVARRAGKAESATSR